MKHARFLCGTITAMAILVCGVVARADQADAVYQGFLGWYLNFEIGKIWSNATTKAQTEQLLEREVESAVDSQAGMVVWDVWYWPTVKLTGASDPDVKLGTFGPTATITSLTHYQAGQGQPLYLYPNWKVEWPSGNGARAAMEVNLSNAPDPDVTVSRMSALAAGTAVVKITSTGTTVTVLVNSMTVDLTAKAEIWGFLTIDVTGQVKSAVKRALQEHVIRKSFRQAVAGWSLPQ